MARATKSRGAVAKPPTKKSAAKPKPVANTKPAAPASNAAPKKSLRGGGKSKSVRRALGDISNRDESDTEDVDEDDVDSIANAGEYSKKGSNAVVEADISNDDDTEMSESDDESVYEEAKKSSKKNVPKKNVPKKNVPKKTAGKKESKRGPDKKSGGESKMAAPTKAPAINPKVKIFEDILDDEPQIKDKDFSNLVGLVRKHDEVNFGGEDDFGGGDWRCLGAVDY